MSDKKIQVMRKGKLREVKKIRIGDIYIGTCWLCGSVCRCEDLRNGFTRHTGIFTEQKAGQGSLFDGAKL